MNTIAKLGSTCARTDCSFTGGIGSITCMRWTPTFDKFGNQTDAGDPNIATSHYSCSTCGKSWTIRTQYGEETITENPRA